MKPKTLLAAFVLLMLTFIFCVPCNAQKPMTLTVTKVVQMENYYEVTAKSKHWKYRAKCPSLPDSVVTGIKILALPTNKPDTCRCVFRRVG